MAAAASARSLGQRRLAEEWFNRAIAVQPRSAFAWHKLALFQREGGRRKEALKTALKAAQMAVEGGADAPYYWHSAGDLALEAEEFAEAEDCLRRALEGSPADHETMILLGIALWRLGKGEESLRSLRLAMELEPEPRLVPGLVSIALRVKGQDEDAEAEERKIDRLGRYDKEQLARLRARMID
jgi:Flp pilus assembly protein TadD